MRTATAALATTAVSVPASLGRSRPPFTNVPVTWTSGSVAFTAAAEKWPFAGPFLYGFNPKPERTAD